MMLLFDQMQHKMAGNYDSQRDLLHSHMIESSLEPPDSTYWRCPRVWNIQNISLHGHFAIAIEPYMMKLKK